jgi:hypothetical protein
VLYKQLINEVSVNEVKIAINNISFMTHCHAKQIKLTVTLSKFKKYPFQILCGNHLASLRSFMVFLTILNLAITLHELSFWLSIHVVQHFMTSVVNRIFCSLIVLPPSSGRPDDGDSTHLRNVGQLKHDYTALHPRKL